MLPAERKLTPERLRELLDYDSEAGIFRWRKRNGAEAGTLNKNDSYRRICVDGEIILAHRLAWLYVHGVWPGDELDHINRNRDDNRISNLRSATKAQNQQNTVLRPNNTSGFKGVSKHKGKWWARVVKDGKRTSLGLYGCPTAAHFAVVTAAKQIHGEFANY